MFRLLINHYPEESGSGSGSVATPDMDKEEVIEFLGDDDEDKEVIPLDTGKSKDKIKEEVKTKEDGKTVDTNDDTDEADEDEESEVDELKELEEELEPPTEEQLELVTPVRRKEILSKYPKLFKDFPYLEKAYYREQQFTELLPTIDDAKTAIEAKRTLDNFEKDMVAGNTEILLKSIKSENPTAFKKIVDNYLPVLAKVDESAYHHVIGNIIRHTIMTMASEGRRSGKEVLSNAAQILNEFTFGTSDFQPPTKLVNPAEEIENIQETKIKEERQAFIKQRFEAARDDLNVKVNNSLKNTIEAHIDPKQSMTDYVRRTASREAMDTLESLISKDSRFKILVDKLWESAHKQNYNKDSIDRIKSAFHSKAKTLLPSVIKKARNDALKGMGRKVKDDVDDSESSEIQTRKSPKNNEQPRSKPSSGQSKKSEVPEGMSTLEFLNSD